MNLYKNDDLVEATNLAINNTLNNPGRQQQLDTFGWGEPQFTTGKNLLKIYEQRGTAQTQLQNEQWALSQQINSGLQALAEQFKEHVRIVQVALRNDTTLLHSLEIDRLAQRRWEFVRQAGNFYGQLQDQKVSLEAYGISSKEIQQNCSAANELLQLKEVRADKKSAAEQSTQDKREAQATLRMWVKYFHTIARMAFRSQPQALEAYGIRVRATV
ncbi:hypothetical protein [Tunicatimonas pelagia]|uniref:hypothetical protein n=1 Tax=Tunicatimonas pelagia TaxID=931531 RepID=UPI00266556E7|nr:hypothetical protein [Tunicatimonas pelagia]WKN46227.1 hypothetical protein P0M28_14845 [Tunicatimonas pelagia]